MRSAASGSDTVDAASPGKKPPRDEARQHAVTASVCCAAISGLTELAAKSLSAFLSPKPRQLRLTPDRCKFVKCHSLHPRIHAHSPAVVVVVVLQSDHAGLQLYTL